jgi:hypothetical protein
MIRDAKAELNHRSQALCLSWPAPVFASQNYPKRTEPGSGHYFGRARPLPESRVHLGKLKLKLRTEENLRPHGYLASWPSGAAFFVCCFSGTKPPGTPRMSGPPPFWAVWSDW